MSSYNIVIAGDLFPSKSNHEKFAKGETEWLFGSQICDIFKKADYRIANLEGTLTNSNKPIEKIGPAISYYPETVNGIKNLGIDLLVTANNHTTDFGKEGYDECIATIAHHGISYIGSGYLSSIEKYKIINADGKYVCIYNVAEEMFNVPETGNPGAHIYDEYTVCNDIHLLKKQYDYIIVIYHGGTEYFPYPTPELKKRFHRMADSGADVITAQHTHCIGCEEYYNNSYLLYGQGNFLFDRQRTPITHTGLFFEVSVNDSLVITKHFFCVSDGRLTYEGTIEPSSFLERNLVANDDEKIKSKYSEFVVTQLKDLTREWRNQTLLSRIARKVLPTACLEKLFGYKVTRAQLNTILYVLKSEQKRETAIAMIKEFMKNNDRVTLI